MARPALISNVGGLMREQASSVLESAGDVRVEHGLVTVRNPAALRSEKMDVLVREAVFGQGQSRDHARWLIWQIGQTLGVRPASIHELYMARGRGEVHGFTVPAINVRGMAYDTARAIFRTAIRMSAGAFILEIARSEIAYTDQRPGEYVAVMLAAALREGFRGPVFIQGDHFQVNAKKFAGDPTGEVAAVKQLAREAVTSGFYNIDVDTSTLVDLKRPTLDEQQQTNYQTAVDIARYIREIEPDGVVISIGGEIGEVGASNSTVPELRTYMDGFNRVLAAQAGANTHGLSKISVQTGTSHGGVVLPDGSIAAVKLDLDTLQKLSVIAREEYGMAGAVQHGASTLPDSAFDNFPRIETAEIHLATNFQNLLFDNIPSALRESIYRWRDENTKDERKATDTDEQFYYKTRKKALGPFKRDFWDMDAEVRTTLAGVYDRTFGFLFEQLKVGNTADLVARHVQVPAQHRSLEATAGVAAAPDDVEAGE
jgi:fructose/tagatose bisphosphate aldolase